MSAYDTFVKALIELTDINPTKVNQSKGVLVKNSKGKYIATFKNFEECLDISTQLDSNIEFVSALETPVNYEITISE